MTESATLDIVHLSDLHVTDAPGSTGALGQDSDAGLRAVLGEIATGPPPDVVVASGDLADKGTIAAYRRLAATLANLGAPVHCLAGNHDAQEPLVDTLPAAGIAVGESTTVGSWLFVFADSNADGQARDGDGRWVDRPDRYLHAEHGAFTPEEHGRLHDTLAGSSAPNAFLWLHHPPVAPDGAVTDDAYADQIGSLVHDHPNIRAIACGHFHTAYEGTLHDRPVLVAPSTSINLDMTACTFAAPGYRRTRLHDDGRVESTAHFLDARFPQACSRPAPPSLVELMLGRITLDELRELDDEQYFARYGQARTGRL